MLGKNAVIAVAITIALSACQSGGSAVSVDEAQKITASLRRATFVPPPKKATDIVRLLEKDWRGDEKRVADLRIVADSPAPGHLKPTEAARFYTRRARAAELLGREQQRIEDYRAAIDASATARTLSLQEKTWLVVNLSLALLHSGDAAEARDLLAEALHNIPFQAQIEDWSDGLVQGHSISWFGLLSEIHATLGELAAADKALDRVVRVREASQTWPIGGQERDVFSGRAAFVRATIFDRTGRYREAEGFYRVAIEKLSTYRSWTLWSGVTYEMLEREAQRRRAALARNLARQGRLLEAENEARAAIEAALKTEGRNSTHTNSQVQILGDIFYAQGRYEEARRLSRASIDSLRAIGASPTSLLVAKARVRVAEALAGLGRWTMSADAFTAIAKDLAASPEVFRAALAGNLEWGLSLLRAGRVAEARKNLAETADRANRLYGDTHRETAEASAFLAAAEAATGDHAAALRRFAAAAPILLAEPAGDTGEASGVTARTARLTAIMESYVGLLADIRGTAAETTAGLDATVEAFRLADVARSTRVQQAVSASAARVSITDPALAELVRREQDAGKQIDSLYAMINNVLLLEKRQQDRSTIKGLKDKIASLRAARQALRGEIQAGFPGYADLIDPRPATIADARTSLSPGEALITTYVGPDRTYVWAIPKTGAIAFRAVDLGRDALAEAVAVVRSALEPNAATLGDIPAFDVARAHALYEDLLEPVKAGWGAAKSLLVVAHGPLGYLPMSLLPTKVVKVSDAAPLFSGYRDVPWLARDHAVTVLPSVTSLRTLRALPAGSATRKNFVGFGDPFFNKKQEIAAAAEKTTQVAMRGLRLRSRPRTDRVDSAQLAMLPRLADTADEVRGIAAALKADPTSSVFLGKAAGETAVKGMDLSAVKVIAFATHGLVPGDLDGLTQPALALSSPTVAGGDDDGLLTLGEILGLRLKADWAVLSACNTGAGEGAGAEAVSGLGRAFFYAGTRALLVSNWPVETTSARQLTTRLFAAQAEDPALERAQALRRAMLALIDGSGPKDASGKVLFSYAHPLFWAPFSLIGDGGGNSTGS